jgi:dephospho-CoA kinase
MIKFKRFIEEGINDPAIFKAVFLAGGPGSGKSFVVGQTALTALGFKLINSDDAFEVALSKVGLEPSPENIFSPKGQELRGKAKALTGMKLKRAIEGRLGLVIDGTGKDYDKIKKQVDMLREIGYDVMMLFVNTDVETALNRNRKRDRSLPDDTVKKMWNDVQKNIGKFQNLFRDRMIVVDNSDGVDSQKILNSVYKRVATWSKTPPNNHIAKQWISQQKKERGIKEDKGSVKHHLGIGTSFKHMSKHALSHFDRDNDGDVDADDFTGKIPDEITGAEKPDLTKRMLKKYDRERKHTRKGVAFEDAQLNMKQSREKMRVKDQHRRELEQLKRRHDTQDATAKRRKEREKQ